MGAAAPPCFDTVACVCASARYINGVTDLFKSHEHTFLRPFYLKWTGSVSVFVPTPACVPCPVL